MKLHNVHGRECVLIGTRYFAARRPQSIADKAHARSASGIRENHWERRIMTQGGNARVIVNQRSY